MTVLVKHFYSAKKSQGCSLCSPQVEEGRCVLLTAADERVCTADSSPVSAGMLLYRDYRGALGRSAL